MKKLFTLFTLLAMFAVVGCNENGGDNINPNEKPTGERIASVEEQMEAIAASLPELKAAASALGNLVDALSPNNVAPATRTENNSNNGVKDQIAELEERIEELEEFIANGGANKEWLDATYATLEMYEETIALLTALQAEVDALKEHISGSTYDLFAEVDDKIESSCESMKEWINEQLSGYYNIAEVDALLSQLEASLTEDSAELRASIEELRESLQHSLGEMREEYKAAIAEAIGEYDGVITEKIASEIEAVNERIDSEIAALNKRLDDIEARLEELENAVTNLINRIQSITYVPTHEDGKARVDCHNASIEGSTMTMDFIISPKNAVADIAERYEEILTLKADIQYTHSFDRTVNLPLIDCTADTERGVISVKVECDLLGDMFFTMIQSARVLLTISDGNNDRNTEYITLFPRYHKQADNMIMYTTYDKKPVVVNWEGEGAFQDLQANTYDGDYGFLVFHSEVTSIPKRAFKDCDNLTTISLPSTVTSIKAEAFLDCDFLRQINIPESIISIGFAAFDGCFSLPVEDGMIYADTYLVEVIDKTQSTYTIKEGTRFINEFTFSYCENLTSIIIPDSVTSIGNHAFFNCTSLTSITIHDSVTEIGNNAFYSCLSLMSISLPNSLNSIEYNSFANCISLTSITIPDSVTEIGAGAFISCTSLASVTIPDSVTEIGERAFCDCTSLTSVTIPESVVSIGDDVFDGCTSLSEFKGGLASADGRCLIIDGVLEVFIPVGLTEYTIPDGVAEIGDRTFGACRGLTSITIPDSVTSIGSGAFVYCTSLTSLTIPDSVTSIGDFAFSDCTSLTSVTIPDSVTSIGDSAFGNCSNLTNVTIGNGVTEIGEHVFSECRSLTSITIPNSVTSIGESAFSDCSSLTSATIGNGVTSIGEWAFSCCTSLTSITIPDSVTKIGAGAFSACESLAEIYCESLTPATITKIQTWVFIWGAFDGNALGRKIYVPTESVDAYKTANGWKEYADDIVGYDFE